MPRPPKSVDPAVSRRMIGNRSSNTKPEQRMRSLLCELGYRGYRLNVRKLPGRPDIVFVTKRIAIFVNGCFWHRCPKCNYGTPKTNAEYWQTKFATNRARDRRNLRELRRLGFRVLSVWECEVLKDESRLKRKIKALFAQ
jgi:DNA mismatch endonuclease, patch repair protein